MMMSRRAISLNGVPFLLVAACTHAIPTSAQVLADLTTVLNTLDQIAVIPELKPDVKQKIATNVNIASVILAGVNVNTPAEQSAVSIQQIAGYIVDILSFLPMVLPPPFGLAAMAIASIIKSVINYASTANPQLKFGSISFVHNMAQTMTTNAARKYLNSLN